MLWWYFYLNYTLIYVAHLEIKLSALPWSGLPRSAPLTMFALRTSSTAAGGCGSTGDRRLRPNPTSGTNTFVVRTANFISCFLLLPRLYNIMLDLIEQNSSSHGMDHSFYTVIFLKEKKLCWLWSKTKLLFEPCVRNKMLTKKKKRKEHSECNTSLQNVYPWYDTYYMDIIHFIDVLLVNISMS